MNRCRNSFTGVLVLLFIGVVAVATSSGKSDHNDKELLKKHAQADITCEQCHGGQATSKTGVTQRFPRTTTEACLKCHESHQKVAGDTRNYQPPYNPHFSHFDPLDCYVCHREHQASVMFCTSCHLELKIPASGWKAAKIPADEAE